MVLGPHRSTQRKVPRDLSAIIDVGGRDMRSQEMAESVGHQIQPGASLALGFVIVGSGTAFGVERKVRLSMMAARLRICCLRTFRSGATFCAKCSTGCATS